MPTTAVLIQRARERRREAKLQALEAQAKEQSAREELQAKIQAERERLRERAERARAPASAGGASRRESEAGAPNMPFTPVSTEAGAARNIPGAAMGEIERLLMEGMQNPAAAAAGGRAVQQAQSPEQQAPAPTAPPVLTSQRTTTETGSERAGGVVLPTRRTRTTTDVSPNVLTASQALRARERRRESLLDRQMVQREQRMDDLRETIETEAKALGGLMFRAQGGQAEDTEALERKVENLRRRFGQGATTLILRRAQNERTRLKVQERQDALQSERTEGRAIRRESRRGGRPSATADRRESEIMLQILERGRDSLTENQRAFLEERRKSDPINSIIRDALGGSAPTGRQATEEDVADAESALRERLGRDPQPWEIRQRLESQGLSLGESR